MEKHDLFIEYVLQKMNIDYDKKCKYFLCNNPISIKNGKTDRTKSATWYRGSGSLRVFNADTLNGKDFISIDEIVSYFGLSKEYCEIMGVCPTDIATFYSDNGLKKTRVKKTNPPKEIQQTKTEYKQCKDYLKKRGLHEEEGKIECVTLWITENFKKPAICFRYKGFNKYRYIDSNKKFRYTSGGRYQELFVAQNTSSDKALVEEGEIDCVTSSYYVKDRDIYGLHNLRSIPKTDILKGYKEVLVLLDADHFDKVKEDVERDMKLITDRDCNVIVREKLDIVFRGKKDITLDYNDMHIAGGLDKETILTGYISKKLIDGKDGFECCKTHEEELCIF